MISKKNLNTHMHIHTHIKELLALNTVHVPLFLHTRTQQLRVAPDEKIKWLYVYIRKSNKTIKYMLFKYKKMKENIFYLK